MREKWVAESLNLPKFKGAFLVRGDSPETAEVMGAEAAAIYINKLEEDKVTLLEALEKADKASSDLHDMYESVYSLSQPKFNQKVWIIHNIIRPVLSYFRQERAAVKGQ